MMSRYDEIEQLARKIEQHAFRRGFVSAFTLTAFPVKSGKDMELHITRECDGLVYGNAEVGTLEAFRDFISALDGRVDFIVCDLALPFETDTFLGEGTDAPENSVLLQYSDIAVWIDSVRYILYSRIPNLPEKSLVITGDEDPEDTFLKRLTTDPGGIASSVFVHLSGAAKQEIPEAYRSADVIIGAAIYRQVIRRECLERCERSPLIVDAGIGTVTPEASEFAMERGFQLIRVDNRAAMAGMLFSLIQSHDLVTRVMGQGEIAGVPVVAGGYIGAPGTIVVDSIDQPSIAIGFADGTGRIRYNAESEDEARRMEAVRQAIGGE